MTHEKTFNAISKLKDIEMELHHLKNALEMANRALDAQRTWVGLTDKEINELWVSLHDDFGNPPSATGYERAIEAKLKYKNTKGQE